MDDTIRTRALNYTRSHWKLALHGASWLLAAIVTASVAVGHKQGDMSHVQETIARVESKLDGVVADVSTIKTEQAGVRESQKDLGERIGRMEDNWDNAYQQAGTWPRPHRGRKP